MLTVAFQPVDRPPASVALPHPHTSTPVMAEAIDDFLPRIQLALLAAAMDYAHRTRSAASQVSGALYAARASAAMRSGAPELAAGAQPPPAMLLMDETSIPDLRAVLAGVQQRVLSDCVLLFTGVIPLGTQATETGVWQIAEALGARCVLRLESRVTHVVGLRWGTQKILEARRRVGCQIVHLNWLIACYVKWSRMPENDFRIPRE